MTLIVLTAMIRLSRPTLEPLPQAKEEEEKFLLDFKEENKEDIENINEQAHGAKCCSWTKKFFKALYRILLVPLNVIREKQMEQALTHNIARIRKISKIFGTTWSAHLDTLGRVCF